MGSNKGRDKWLHSMNLCVKCKKKDADTLAGRWYCRECADARNLRIAMSRKPEKDKEKRKERREAGLCTVCGKKVDVEGKVRCSACAELAYKRQKDYWERKYRTEVNG